MSGAIPPLSNTPSWRGAQLKKKHRDNFTLRFIQRGLIIAPNDRVTLNDELKIM